MSQNILHYTTSTTFPDDPNQLEGSRGPGAFLDFRRTLLKTVSMDDLKFRYSLVACWINIALLRDGIALLVLTIFTSSKIKLVEGSSDNSTSQE